MKGNRLKKHTLHLSDGSSVVLKEEIGQGGYSSIYSTSDPNYVAKVMLSTNQQSYNIFKMEKLGYSALYKHKNIVFCRDTIEFDFKGQHYCALILENCPRGCLFDILEYIPGMNLQEIQLLRIAKDVLEALTYVHGKNFIHRDIKIENILLGNDNIYKLCDFGSMTNKIVTQITKDNRQEINDDYQKNTTPQYRAPELLDLFQNNQINHKIDIFALGVVLFILSFQKPPFETQLAAINKQYFIPDTHNYSEQYIQLFELMFTTDPAQRPSAPELLKYLEQHFPSLTTNSHAGVLSQELFVKSRQKQVTPGFLMTCKKMLARWTTKTEGWIMSAVQEDEFGPKQKYVRFLIVKSWNKKEKVQKFYQLLNSVINKNIDSTIIILKTLIVLHNYFRKGPAEAITAIGFPTQPLTLLLNIKNHWLQIQNNNIKTKKDVRRSQYLTNLIVSFTNLLISKLQLCVNNCNLFEGNYSLQPFFSNMSKNFKPLTPTLLDQLLDFLDATVKFQDFLLGQFQLWNIQCSLVLAIVDEEYCLLSLLTHLLHTFKQSSNYLNMKLDQDKLSKKIKQLEKRFCDLFKCVHKFFLRCSALKDTQNYNFRDIIPRLNLDVIAFIQSIPILQNNQKEFNIFQFLNYKLSICGLNIPLSYGNAVNQQLQANQLEAFEHIDLHKRGCHTTTSHSNSEDPYNYDMTKFQQKSQPKNSKYALQIKNAAGNKPVDASQAKPPLQKQSTLTEKSQQLPQPSNHHSIQPSQEYNNPPASDTQATSNNQNK